MPVFTRTSGSALVVMVDGDYTLSELRRVAERGLAAPGTPTPARVLLDMSGAAAPPGREAEDVTEAAAFFAEKGPEVERVAIQAHVQLEARPAGARVFHTRAEAMAWLDQGGDA